MLFRSTEAGDSTTGGFGWLVDHVLPVAPAGLLLSGPVEDVMGDSIGLASATEWAVPPDFDRSPLEVAHARRLGGGNS